MKILTKYILKELFYFYMLAFMVFSILFMFGNVYKIINFVFGKGIPVYKIIYLFLLYIPSSFQLTIPMSLMIAILMSLGRMAADSEIIVIYSCGVKNKVIIKPILMFSVFLTLFGFLSTNYLSPVCMYEARKLKNNIITKSPLISLEENKPITINGKKILVKKIVDNTIFDIMIQDENKNIITADNGVFIKNDTMLTMILNNGIIQKSIGTDYKEYEKMPFSSMRRDIIFNEDNEYNELAKEREEMSFYELSRKIKTDDKWNEPKNYFELYSKFAIPFTCIAFMFIALPIGLSAKKTGKSIGFTWGLLSIFIYYLFFAGIKSYSLSLTDFSSIKYIVWIPNILVIFLGLLFFIYFKKKRS